MDQFIAEIEAYATARNLRPATVIQYAVNASGTVWDGWKAGTRSCSVRTMDRIRAYIAAHPAPESAPGADSSPSPSSEHRHDPSLDLPPAA